MDIFNTQQYEYDLFEYQENGLEVNIFYDAKCQMKIECEDTLSTNLCKDIWDKVVRCLLQSEKDEVCSAIIGLDFYNIASELFDLKESFHYEHYMIDGSKEVQNVLSQLKFDYVSKIKRGFIIVAGDVSLSQAEEVFQWIEKQSGDDTDYLVQALYDASVVKDEIRVHVFYL